MSSGFLQATRPLTLKAAVAADTFVVAGVQGTETISELYRFEVELLSEKRKSVKFEDLLGSKASVAIARDQEQSRKRFLSGIICAAEQREAVQITENGSPRDYTKYRISIVPKLWLLSLQVRSRTFQRKTVLDILKIVLKDCDADFEIGARDVYQPRDYCVQYRESDLAFAKRLMEEEGLFFYFRHSESEHRMIVTNNSAHAEDCGTFLFESQEPLQSKPDRISVWRKTQEIRAAKHLVRDFSFELPDQNLEKSKQIQSAVQVAGVTHKLDAGGLALEKYRHPGGYAGRYDGVSKDGGDQDAQLQHIFTDSERAAALLAQAEVADAVRISGESSECMFAPGAKFLFRNRQLEEEGEFFLVSTTHFAQQPIGTTADGSSFTYRNEFGCIPAALPYVPNRKTPTPLAHGTQSAKVVGPQGQEVFTDKYGRVKVQFRWDREGTFDSGSSCWVRVASDWAGKNWGSIHIPRIGQEVVVAFEEGDPNQPIIVGSVYNADNMPPYKLPGNATQSGVKSHSTPNASGSNEFRFEDKHGSEEIFLHAEKDLVSTIEHDETRTIRNDRATTITGNEKKTIQRGNETIALEQGSQSLTIQQGDQKITLSMGNQTTKISLGKSETEAMQSIELKVGQSSIKLDQSGVTIKGLVVKIEAELEAELKSMLTQVKGDALVMAKGGVVMIN